MGCFGSRKSYAVSNYGSSWGDDSSLVDNEGKVRVDKFSTLEIDRRVPMTKKEVFRWLQSWKAIRPKMCDVGVEMFVRLFKTNEGLQSMFQQFKDIKSDDELRSNEALEYHATMVMTTLDDAITHIDNYDFVHDLLSETGASHKRFKGFEPTTFLTIKQPFLDAVKVTLGDRYTENMENIYTIAINFLIDTMVEGLREGLKDDGPAPIAPILRKIESQQQNS